MIEIEGLEELQEMLAAGNEELADMQRKIDELDQQITVTRNQIGEQDRLISQHARALDEARALFSACADENHQAHTYARIAHEIHKQDAIKVASEAKKKLETQQKAVAKLEKDDSAQSKKTELETALARLQRDKEVYQGQIGAVQRSVKKLGKELAERTCHDLEAEFEQKQARVEELRTQLVNAEMDLHQFHSEALAQLEGHREVWHHFRNLIPQEDSTSRIIAAAILYSQTLLREYDGATFGTLPVDGKRQNSDHRG